jgi:hypothetical protein
LLRRFNGGVQDIVHLFLSFDSGFLLFHEFLSACPPETPKGGKISMTLSPTKEPHGLLIQFEEGYSDLPPLFVVVLVVYHLFPPSISLYMPPQQ